MAMTKGQRRQRKAHLKALRPRLRAEAEAERAKRKQQAKA